MGSKCSRKKHKTNSNSCHCSLNLEVLQPVTIVCLVTDVRSKALCHVAGYKRHKKNPQKKSDASDTDNDRRGHWFPNLSLKNHLFMYETSSGLQQSHLPVHISNQPTTLINLNLVLN